MNSYAKKLMAYHIVHQLSREGFSVAAISKHLVMDWRTVRKYLDMSEAEYEQFLGKQTERKRELDEFEGFVKSRLGKYPDTSAAQMHDWLKEHYPHFPVVDSKTVFNFVCHVRQKYNIDKTPSAIREYTMVPEAAYGAQAQADFGEYNLRNSQGRKVKVYFFAMSLSRSRYKYLFFSLAKFSTEMAILAHQQAFVFFAGIPETLVYDQDRAFIVDENSGDIILTEKFKNYARGAAFTLHFCRKADPESKGKIENIIKYVKRNFLYNRPFDDLETLNQEALAWLARTANHLPHSSTRLQPSAEWEIEKRYLRPCRNIEVLQNPLQPYTVRKDNSISYKGNYYSVPIGTYQGKGSEVEVRTDDGKIACFNKQGVLICIHNINTSKGKRIINNDHRREKTGRINELITQICTLIPNQEQMMFFIANIRTAKPRYVRDQLLLILQTITTYPATVATALEHCCKQKLSSAADLKSIAQHLDEQNSKLLHKSMKVFALPQTGMPSAAYIQPQTSSITDYDMF